MQNITSKIVADSINPGGKRITTFLVTYPRFIHAEIMTHRVFSRNAASSRAIPIAKQIRAVRENPAHPERWGTNGKGMQDRGVHDNTSRCQTEWEMSSEQALENAEQLNALGLHKQIVNRVLEPFSHITVLITATQWDNFFSLRAHPAAQPEFQVLAYRMLADYLSSEPEKLNWGEWHLPFTDGPESANYDLDQSLVHSVACAARTSYTAHDSEFPYEKQKELYDRLASSGHWSPFEHQAQASFYDSDFTSGNFKGGWKQYRTIFPTQNQQGIDLKSIMAEKPEWITV